MMARGKAIERVAFAYAGLCLTVLAGALLSAGSAQAGEVTGSAALTTGYVWRGSSQTLEKPAAQSGIKVTAQQGFYASAWGSNVESAPAVAASSEFDLAFGWAGKVDDDWAIDVSALRYVYPGTAINLDWNELNAAATWRDRAWLGVGYSHNAMASGANGTYVSGGVRIPAGKQVRFELGAGHYAMSDALPDYSHAWVSGLWAFKEPFELRITAHATDVGAKSRFGRALAGTRVEAALQASF